MCKRAVASLILLMIFFLTACTSSTNVGISDDFDTEANSIISMIDDAVKNKKELNDKEKHRIDLLTSKYATEDQKERRSYVVTLIAMTKTYVNDIYNENDSGEKLKLLQKYYSLHDEIKVSLNTE